MGPAMITLRFTCSPSFCLLNRISKNEEMLGAKPKRHSRASLARKAAQGRHQRCSGACHHFLHLIARRAIEGDLYARLIEFLEPDS